MATFLHECEPGALRSSLTCAGLTSVSKPTRPTVFRERAGLDGATRRAAGRTQEPKGVSCCCCVTQSTPTMIDYVALNMAVM